MINAIVFDWGGVLIDNPADGLIEFCSSSLKISPDILKSELSKIMTDFQRGSISETDLWKKICSHLQIKEPTASSLWRNAVDNVFKDNKKVYELVKKLRSNGYKTGLLSNTEIPTTEYFYDNGYEKYFDSVAFSCVEKSIKPEAKIFNILLGRLGTKPQETIFIDDKLKYVESAEELGIRGILFHDSNDLVVKLKSLGINTN